MSLSFCKLEDQVYAKEGKSLPRTTFDSKCLISNERVALFLECSFESSTLRNKYGGYLHLRKMFQYCV